MVRKKHIRSIAALAMLSACHADYGEQSVWQHYDYIETVNQNSGVSAPTLQPVIVSPPAVIDNDNDYRLPYYYVN